MPGPPCSGYFFELAVAQVAIEIFVFGVFQIGVRPVDFRIDVAVRHQNVEPAVVIHVEEADAPAEQARIDAQTAWIGAVFEVAVAEIRVQRIGVAGEVCFDDVEVAVAVVVADGDAHAGLRLCPREIRRRPTSMAMSLNVPSFWF